jgi:hypothetical protein
MNNADLIVAILKAARDARSRRPVRRLASVEAGEIGDEVAVAFEHVDDLKNVAIGLGGKIAHKNQVAFEWSGADVGAQVGASTAE